MDKNDQHKFEDAIILDIRFSRGVVLSLIAFIIIVGVIGYFALVGNQAFASDLKSISATTGQRKYYLTDAANKKNGASANSGCVSGYHFASMWEIIDPSNLEYNTTEGFSSGDIGSGPPTNTFGWVQTGYVTSSGNNIAGQANCSFWTDSTSGEYGSVVALPSSWISSPNLSVWNVGTSTCDISNHVWCVED